MSDLWLVNRWVAEFLGEREMPGDEWQPVQGFFREKSRTGSARARLIGWRSLIDNDIGLQYFISDCAHIMPGIFS